MFVAALASVQARKVRKQVGKVKTPRCGKISFRISFVLGPNQRKVPCGLELYLIASAKLSSH